MTDKRDPTDGTDGMDERDGDEGAALPEDVERAEYADYTVERGAENAGESPEPDEAAEREAELQPGEVEESGSG